LAGINPNINMNFTGTNAPVHGKGRDVAKTFQEASFAQRDGYEGTNTLSEMGLRTIKDQHGATEREQLVAQVAMNQLKSLDANNTVRVSKGVSSRSIALSESLSYIASGGVASGPIGAILADLGSRQMDSIRMQSFNSASSADIRDSNVAGYAMMQQIAERVDDPNLQIIAHNALDQVGDRYQKSEKEGKIGGDERNLLDDSKVLFAAFDGMKAVACQGDASNPKSIAFLDGVMPAGGNGSIGAGRPGGRTVSYPSSGLGFGVSKEHKWDY